MGIKIKKPKWFIAIVAFLVITVGAGILIYELSLPKGTYMAKLRMSCVSVHEGDVEWSKAVMKDTLYLNDEWYSSWSKWDLRINMSALRNVKYTETDDVITDAQVVELVITDKDRKELYKTCFAYDFYLKKVYVQKDGKWFRVKNSKVVDRTITSALDAIPSYVISTWRGQSTYSSNEFSWYDPDVVFQEKPTFRYNLHWTPSSKNYENARMDYQATGFRNTNEVTISNSEEAVQRAAEELGFSNPHGYAYYDETCGYWMVEIYDNIGYENLTYYEYMSKLTGNTKTVIIDDRGITKEIYTHITIPSVFIGLPEEAK